jgi:hypothetical protein
MLGMLNDKHLTIWYIKHLKKLSNNERLLYRTKDRVMSKMKDSLAAYSVLLAAAMMGDEGYMERDEYRELTDEEKVKLKSEIKKKKVARLEQRGVKKFFYGDNVIYARNKKNADRKAKNKGYLTK